MSRPPNKAGPAPILAAGEEIAGQAAAKAPRILVVEDEYLVAVELEHGLTEVGFAVVGIATTAAAAVRLAKDERPALIIMDIRLSGRRDGIDAAIDIYNATGIRSIFATAHAEPGVRQRAAPAAPLGWIVKPYRTEMLIELIHDALRQPPG